jgi:hypothetical protein
VPSTTLKGGLTPLSLWYRVLYGLGIRPWDRDGPVPELVAVAGDLPPARALDLGCGTGAQAVYLARAGTSWPSTPCRGR